MCFTLFEGDVADRGASNQTREKTRADLLDFSPPDPNHTHVTNAQPLISLVKANLISLRLNFAVSESWSDVRFDNMLFMHVII